MQRQVQENNRWWQEHCFEEVQATCRTVYYILILLRFLSKREFGAVALVLSRAPEDGTSGGESVLRPVHRDSSSSHPRQRCSDRTNTTRKITRILIFEKMY